MSDDTPSVLNPGYATGQLRRAIAAALGHPDAAARARALGRISRWQAVLAGLFDGTLRVGTRTPVADAPAWATLEVVTGGFATGALLAGGPLRDHEHALLARLGLSESDGRAALNAWFLSDEGLAELRGRLRSGAFRVEVPEEGAWLVVAWLLEAGDAESALEIVAALAPFCDRLRFYPVPAEPALQGPTLHRRSVAQVREALAARRVPAQLARQTEVLTAWLPWLDAGVALLLETVEGEAPRLATDAAGALVRRADGQPVVEGGWPASRWPEGWAARARDLLDRCPAGEAPRRVASVRAAIGRLVNSGDSMDLRERGMLRRMLAGVVSQRGLPGAAELRALRETQAAIASRPTYAAFAHLLARRLAALPGQGGIPEIAGLDRPVSADESAETALPAQAAIPGHVLDRLWIAVEGTVEQLVARGVVGSSEVLAELLPQITAEAQTAAIPDPALRPLYAAIYRAFRRRRGLLLLDLSHQVRIDELPWVSALARHRAESQDSRAVARQTLEDLAALALASFPHTLLPNPLITELDALARSAGLSLPWVEELAADIFTGTFTGKFVEASKVAADLLDGRLYSRYYGIDWAPLRAVGEVKDRWGRSTAPGFAELCALRAGPRQGPGSWVAKNGMVLEQQQILTTHNLALLLGPLGLRARLQPHLGALARRCLRWIGQQLALPRPTVHDRLRMVKNVAYAWRQMVFFLSFVEPDELAAVLDEARALPVQGPFAARVGEAVDGLRQVAEGAPLDPASPSRRLLGWSDGAHWLIA